MFRNKKTIPVLLAVFAILVSTTLALQQTIKASNEFMGRGTGEEGDDEVVLHDDFDPEIGMKDIYVENIGNTVMYVRVKLDEAMDLTSYTWRPGAGDFKSHIYNPTANECSRGNSSGILFHSYFEWNMGGWKYYKPASSSNKIVSDTKVYTEDDYNNSALNLEKTPNALITTAADFLAMTGQAQKAFIGWIYDTDGYAYWSQPLAPKTATGLLLHGVKTSPALNNTDYYYVINVLAEAVDIDDIPMWTEGATSVEDNTSTMTEATEDGKEVILIIVGGGDNGGDTGGTDPGGDTGNDNGGNTDPDGDTGGDGGGDNGGDNGGDTGGDGDNGGDNGGDPGDDPGGNTDPGGDGDNGGDTGGGENQSSELTKIPGLDSSTKADTVLNIDGSEWIVIKNIEMEGCGYAMLLKKTAMGHVIFDMSGTLYEGSPLQTAFTQAYTDSHIPTLLMKNAVVPKLGDDSKNAVSAPTSKLASAENIKKDIIFPLSYKEATDWSGSTNNGKLYMSSQRWWLRTPDDAQWHYVITYNPNEGSIISSPTIGINASDLHLRPAIWVKYDIN